jgi:hypothetical protein
MQLANEGKGYISIYGLKVRPHVMLLQSLGRSWAISPRALSLLISHLLYHEFKSGGVAPIIAGLERSGAPLLCTQGA